MYRTNEEAIIKKDWKLWEQGFRNLYNLDCEFIAIYGAEPLQDFDYLPELFSFTTNLGMYHTLITNCTGPDVKEKLEILANYGLNSLTVSFDGENNELKDSSSSIKSSIGLDTIRWFGSNFNVRDRAVVFTLTKTNLFSILDWIPIFAKEDIFVFFDLIHNDIYNPGTKCRNYEGIQDLLFTMEDLGLLREFAIKLKKLKDEKKYTIHQSDSFIDMLIKTPELYVNKKWNCARDNVFPSWVTIDNTGIARVCDDFYIKEEKDWYFWELSKDIFLNDFSPYWKNKVIDKCNGCLWNTHYDANKIKEGSESFSNYLNNCL
jgi:MoaA/NifB/PqqE/SkfB family radical SAM enzyme